MSRRSSTGSSARAARAAERSRPAPRRLLRHRRQHVPRRAARRGPLARASSRPISPASALDHALVVRRVRRGAIARATYVDVRVPRRGASTRHGARPRPRPRARPVATARSCACSSARSSRRRCASARSRSSRRSRARRRACTATPVAQGALPRGRRGRRDRRPHGRRDRARPARRRARDGEPGRARPRHGRAPSTAACRCPRRPRSSCCADCRPCRRTSSGRR